MGIYLNPGTIEFQESINSEIYVDKTMLIERTNAALRTKQKYMCISRPRRFGKSMAVDMLAAYYGKDYDSAALFDGLEISHCETFSTHLNKYNVFKINMQEFLSITQNVDEMLKVLQKRLIKELKYNYPEYVDCDNLVFAMQDIFSYTGQSFIVLIDEWDCLFREYKQDEEAQRKYLDFLRVWLKDKAYIALAYMTGILPVKKYGTHSALNMFMEYSMTDPGNMAEYFGFTEKEVENLCIEYGMSIEETKAWYNGYGLYDHNKQEDILIQMNMDGLKDAIIEMLAGNSVRINIGTFHNDMTTFATRDDILTLLVHLGYLTYDVEKESVRIPNKEVAQEYINAISTMDWKEVISSINNSRKLLEALWNLDSDKVAAGVDKAHEEISILQYNDENSLSCTISLAFYFAREYYTMIRELPTGKGFADICLIPRKIHMDKPAVIIELKWDKSASGAIAQIKEKKYIDALSEYQGNLLLAGINYDKKIKKHTCLIEKVDYKK